MKRLKKEFVVLLLLTISLIVFTSCKQNSKNTSTSSNSPTQTNISGNLTLYTSQPDQDAQGLVKAFNEKYPDVKVNVFRSGTEEVVSKILAEKKSGKVMADVVLLADAVTFETLKENDLLQSYDSPEATKIPKQFIDKDKMYYGTKLISTIIAINTQKVKTTPDSWKSLIDPAAKGQVIMPSPLYSGAAAYNIGVLVRQKDFGWDFYKKLKSNGASVTQGNGGVIKAVASGEKPYGVVVDFMAAREKAKGSLINLVYPKEGVLAITEPVGIIKGTSNENAAKAFVDFILSKEGQSLEASMGYNPLREGVKPPAGLEEISKLKVLDYNIQELYKSREEDKKKFSEIFSK
ncbi:ABC transporter substrate-binding protein [Thermoanaerobacterium sp. RBIITD]|uniref:ABC transporter substrate-binding protein n=1 Tax=Thermoanaerobacterium sp. RBIITD TaxID=1550240 RepID=UPI000BBFB12B|nr:ABC transporter substrate-binding protein [Thermoanaerobacterium sp. RBIITD]SNX54235.1 iron(III) transport system substrate-binding protein [Thermoanaerobacterium sp. RBIITD]